MEKTYFLYRYVRHDKNVPFYIGIGTKKEEQAGYPLYSIRSIYGRAYSKDRNKTCLGIMYKTGYDIEIMYEDTDKQNVEEKEKFFISLYGFVYDGTGTLTNLTKGGTSFKTTDEYVKNHHMACKKHGVEFSAKKKPMYMYDLDGNFIEKFDAMNDFSKKYKFGANSKAYLSEAVKRKVSYKGYFFVLKFYEKLDISQYKSIDLGRIPIVKYDKDKPVAIYNSSGDACKDAGVAQCTMVHKAKIGGEINGFTYKRVRIHELPKIN